MADPLTALVYAVQVMNFLRTLIERTLREREDSAVEPLPPSVLGPDDDSGPCGPWLPIQDREGGNNKLEEGEGHARVLEEPSLDSSPQSLESDLTTESSCQNFLVSIENIIPSWTSSLIDNCPVEVVSQVNSLVNEVQDDCSAGPSGRAPKSTTSCKPEQPGDTSLKRGPRKSQDRQAIAQVVEKGVAAKTNILGRLNSRMELTEAWR